MSRRPKRRLLIDILVPSKDCHRLTITGDDLTVSPDALDKWQVIAEELMAIAARRSAELQSAVLPSPPQRVEGER